MVMLIVRTSSRLPVALLMAVSRLDTSCEYTDDGSELLELTLTEYPICTLLSNEKEKEPERRRRLLAWKSVMLLGLTDILAATVLI